MCRGTNRHRYTVTVKMGAPRGIAPLAYTYHTYKGAVNHTRRLNPKKQPRLSRWYNAGPSAKVMIQRTSMASMSMKP